MPPVADLLQAALAAPLGPHPDADTLRQYAAGTLAPAQQHRIEAHTLACERCADVLDGLAQTDAATTERAVAALRARLQTRVAQAADPRPATGAWHWPRLAAAAAVVAGLAGGGLWEWQRRAVPLASETAAVAPAPAPRQAAPLAAPTPPAAVAGALSARTAPVVTVAPQRRLRPAPSVAYNAPPAAYKEPELDEKNNAKPSKAAPPVIAAALADVSSAAAPAGAAVATDSMALADQAPAPDQPSALGARTLMSRAAGVAVTTNETASAPPAARKMARALPPNSAALSPMPAAPALAPAPVGGLGALREYLRRQATEFVPDGAPLKGSVRVRFVVGDDGKISGLKVLRGLRADYDAEALRLLCAGPGWVPGVAAGRRAALPVEMDVAF